MSSKTTTTAPLSVLLEPLQLRDLTLRNRVFMPPLTRNRATPTTDGPVPNEVNVEYYRQRAESAGLIVTEGVLITRQGYVLDYLRVFFRLPFPSHLDSSLPIPKTRANVPPLLL